MDKNEYWKEGDEVDTLERLEKIVELSQKFPQLLEILQLLKDVPEGKIMMPVKADKLIGTNEAIAILKTSTKTFRKIWQEGYIDVVYTPNSGERKFWLSQVMAVPKKQEWKI